MHHKREVFKWHPGVRMSIRCASTRPNAPRYRSQSTANALGLEKWKAGEALEKLKLGSGLPPNNHGKILSNGNYIDPKTGKVLGNIFEYDN